MVQAKQRFSTLLQVIINRVQAIFLDGEDITGAAPHVLFKRYAAPSSFPLIFFTVRENQLWFLLNSLENLD